MKLAKLRLRNFRCYRDEISVDFSDITALIGRNDAGKSTLMEALDIFLNEGKPDKDDASKSGDGKDLTIICEFEELPDEVIIDDVSPTKFANEYLLNEEGRLEIHKTYSGHLATPKCESIAAFALHPQAEKAADLLQLKNSDLKRRAKDIGVDLSGVDQKVNAQLRQQIREHIGKLELQPSLIPLNNENAKKIWTELRRYLPLFALFKSDRASTDQDSEAQDPLKTAVKEAIKMKEAELQLINDFVETEVRKIACATLAKLSEMDPTLATQLNPQFSPPKWESLFKASITGDENIPINKRGSGVKRLILLNFFRAKAEQKVRELECPSVIYGVEEPETSQHPNNQRMLLRALTDLSVEAQVVLSTHTPMLVRAMPDENLRYVHVGDNGQRTILSGGSGTNELFAKSLGVLPDNNVKLFIGIEGKHDINFLLSMSDMLRREGVDVLDLPRMELDGEVMFFPLGGSTLALWTSRLAPLGRPEFHIYDRDVPPPAHAKYQTQVDEVNLRERCKACTTSKKEMENYLHPDAIVRAYNDLGITISIPSKFADFDDVPLKVAELVHNASGSPTPWASLLEKKRNEKESRAKRILNSSAVRYMTKEMLDEVDTDGDLLQWFQDMKTLAEA